MKNWFRANYLDASAIIKILVDEDSSSPVQKYFHNSSSCFRMTSLCFTEALSVLKAQYFYRKKITRKGYLNRSYRLVAWLRDRRILLDEVDLSDSKIFEEVESIIKEHRLDLSDAFQTVTIKWGKYSNFSGESQSLLITADRGLAKAARSEGIKVWECSHEPVP